MGRVTMGAWTEWKHTAAFLSLWMFDGIYLLVSQLVDEHTKYLKQPG